MGELEKEYIELDFRELIKIIWNKKIIILLITMITVIVSIIFGKLKDIKSYTAMTNFIINEKTIDNEGNILNNNIFFKDYQEIITSNKVVKKVVKTLNLKISASELKNNLKVIASKDTRVFTLNYIDNDETQANFLANSIRDTAIEEIKKVFKDVDITVIDEAASAIEQSNFNFKKIVLGSAFLSLFISIGFITIIEIFDNRIKSAKELKRISNIKILGVVNVGEENSKYEM